MDELLVYTDTDLVVFEGKTNSAAHYHGAGVLTYRNGAVFEGFFSNGLRTGFGRL